VFVNLAFNFTVPSLNWVKHRQTCVCGIRLTVEYGINLKLELHVAGVSATIQQCFLQDLSGL
jgi:hypothetical protein